MVVTTMGYPVLEVGHDRSLADKPPPRPHRPGHRRGVSGPRTTWTRSQMLCGTRSRRAHRAGDAAL